MARIKTYKKLTAAILLMGLFRVPISYAQVLPDLQKDFAAYQQNNLREKIFVHINKNFYATGEILWFKIYCTDANDNKPTRLSKVAYVELIDETHNAVIQSMVALNDGTGNGSLHLPFSLNTGHYVFRAYTSWMKNFDHGLFFSGSVTIFNPRALITETKGAGTAYNGQFFPEGGQLLQGAANRVAFKVTGGDGKGVASNGFVLTSHGDTAVKFNSLKFGIGSFMLTPLPNETYKAVIKVNGQTIAKDLQQVFESGYVMQVNDDGDRWNVHIQNAGNPSANPVYLILHNNFAIKQVEEVHPGQQGFADISIDKSKADDGIDFITLFDAQHRPVCERVIFKRPAARLIIEARPDQPHYETRKKVSIALSTRDEHNNSRSADLSMSVYRDDQLQDIKPDHISGYLLLRAGLKGYIESPDFYLENTDVDANKALDNLLISQGWTQFDWSSVSDGNKSKFKFLPEYTGPIITAQITNIVNNKPARGIVAYLTVNGEQQLYLAKSDSSGRLLFNVHNFYGQHEIFVQTNSTLDSTYRIDVQNSFAERDATSFIEPLVLNQTNKKALAENSLNMQVQNIFSGSQIRQYYNPLIDSARFFGRPDKTYKLDDYTRFTTMEEVLREYVGSISVAKRRGKFHIETFNIDQPLGEPLVLLDGVPVFDADKLFKWDPLKIKKLDMITQDYLYGPALFNGIMNFTTYKGDGTNFEIDPHAVVLDFEGLQLERKFYSPVYDFGAEINSPVPDFRTALYWNPGVGTDTQGKGGLSFYTSDKPGQYIGVVEGITAQGKSGSSIFRFQVTK